VPSRACLLHVLTLLTLAASGDDFCLPGLLFSPQSAASDPLPLHDPTSDFVAPTKPRVPGPSEAGSRRTFVAARPCPALIAPVVTSPSPSRDAVVVGRQHFPFTESSPPLRC